MAKTDKSPFRRGLLADGKFHKRDLSNRNEQY
jgi:hypothetical protein